ncbi:hypothetical protein L9F63_023752, partial [Diploptera punctata]
SYLMCSQHRVCTSEFQNLLFIFGHCILSQCKPLRVRWRMRMTRRPLGYMTYPLG